MGQLSTTHTWNKGFGNGAGGRVTAEAHPLGRVKTVLMAVAVLAVAAVLYLAGGSGWQPSSDGTTYGTRYDSYHHYGVAVSGETPEAVAGGR